MRAPRASRARTIAEPFVLRPIPQPTWMLQGRSQRVEARSSRVVGADAGLLGPGGGSLRECEGPEGVEVLAERGGPGDDAARFEEERRDAESEREVAARARGDVRVGQGRGLVPDGVDEDEPGAAGLRLLEEGKEVDVRDERVLPPEEDPLRVREVEEVVRLLVAEVGLLRGVAGSGADVAALDGDRAEELEEVVHDALHEAERAARAVVEDRGGPGFGADRQEALRGEGERLLPGDGTEAVAARGEAAS